MWRFSSRKVIFPAACWSVVGSAGSQFLSFDHLILAERRCWLVEMVAWLEQKMQREQAYLARRQARSIYYTAIGEAYERDSVDEQAL